MRCSGVSGKQTELEFVYSLWSKESNECRGPLAKLRLQGYAYREVMAALDCVSARDVLEARTVGEITADGGWFEMCAGHWYDVAMVVGGMAEPFQRPHWETLKTSLFILISRASGWDYREMLNRFTSFYQAKLAGK